MHSLGVEVYRHWGKRALDVMVGSLLALCFLPLVLAFALVSAAVFRASPFFVQQRVGRDGRPFSFLKLRSMPRCTPRAVDKYALRDASIPVWGRFIRRTHIDELPQLLLVPLGRMSLVGPRPEMPEICKRYSPEFLEARLSVRPGCTGLWQVSGALNGMIYEAPEYDLTYVENLSLRLDMWVIVRTFAALFLNRTIDSLDDVPSSLLRMVPSPVGTREAAVKV